MMCAGTTRCARVTTPVLLRTDAPSAEDVEQAMQRQRPEDGVSESTLDEAPGEGDLTRITMTHMPSLGPNGGRTTAGAKAAASDLSPVEPMADFVLVTTVRGKVVGATFVPRTECVVIGSHPSADLVLRDPSVSRFHCEITGGERAAVRDLGSRNGTSVNGVTVAQAPLTDGAVLTVGSTTLRFERSGTSARIALSERDRFGRMVGRSAAMRAVFALCEQAAASESTVLIEGETGTGKEATAEAIHRESVRRDGPFIIIDCGAIPPQLLESELFGHERGAFTGAVATRQGAFQAASGGSIFLDEIGELGLELQPKLLRALERREVKPVGSNHYQPVDVRVLAATNRNLREEVTARRFRSDLYYRVAVLRVRLPPLREHKEDLGLLLEHLLEGLGAADRPEARALRSEAFMNEVARHAWPGNVRELRNYVERCLASREQPPPQELESADSSAPLKVATAMDISQPLRAAREAWVTEFERRYLTELLRHHEDNVTSAARAAGVDRIHFYRLLWKHGLRSREPNLSPAPRSRPE
jgi:two-component system, NtrC family, response regulator GlrR